MGTFPSSSACLEDAIHQRIERLAEARCVWLRRRGASVDAAELAQEATLRLLKGTASGSGLCSQVNQDRWLAGLVRNVAREMTRELPRRRAECGGQSLASPARAPEQGSVDLRLTTRRQRELVRRMGRLTPAQCEVVTLVQQGLCENAIARELSIDHASVRDRQTRAVRRLRGETELERGPAPLDPQAVEALAGLHAIWGLVARLHEEGLTAAQIGLRLGRSRAAIRSLLQRLRRRLL